MKHLAVLAAFALASLASHAQEGDVAVIELKPHASNPLGYDKTDLTVKAGQKVKLTFNNTGSIAPQPHNFLLNYWLRLGLIGLAAGIWIQVAFWRLAWQVTPI